MSGFNPPGNRLVTCPYDPVHRMKESRLQLHIAKCKLDHLDMEKKVCPFNATHLLPVGEYDHHLMNCPDRGALDRQFAQAVDKNNPFKGRTDVPDYSEPIPADEVWTIDQPHSIELSSAPVGAILEPRPFAKPAERKQFYQNIHLLPTKAENSKTPTSTAVSPAPQNKPQHRQPVQPSEIKSKITQSPNPQVIESLGLGRGKPVSRIAANFPKKETSENATYSSMVSDMRNLGLGRGTPNNKSYQAPSIFDDDKDFPALGCGRGTMVNQNARFPGARPKNGYKG